MTWKITPPKPFDMGTMLREMERLWNSFIGERPGTKRPEATRQRSLSIEVSEIRKEILVKVGRSRQNKKRFEET